MPMKEVRLEDEDLIVKLVPREQLRAPTDAPRMKLPVTPEVKGARLPLPAPPEEEDFRGDTVFPMLLNNELGDCFYTSVLHTLMAWRGMYDQTMNVDLNKLRARYLALSGGDNGLTWSQMMGEFRGGVIGPSGPDKADGILMVPSGKRDLMSLGQHLTGNLTLTMGIPQVWLDRHARSGGVWDAVEGARTNPDNGHAVMSAKRTTEGYLIETWGFAQPILLTYAGARVCDLEAAVVVGASMFSPAGLSPSGHTQADTYGWLSSMGMKGLPTPEPVPTPGPTPGPGQTWSASVSGKISGDKIEGTLSGMVTGAIPVARPAIEALKLELTAKGLTPDQVASIVALILQLVELFGRK